MATPAQREQCGQPRPDWVPEQAGPAFATWVLQGATPSGVVPQSPVARRRRLNLEDYVEGIQKRDTSVLARAITLVESNAPAHQELAQALLRRLLPATGRAKRVGITGIPGAGKSTFIEALGMRLCEAGQRLAVLAVDPSSSVSGGSILGDKVRMERLGRASNAFIRPSPSGGTLGGVARKTREAMLLCEAAGFDVVIVETVGVGQSEVSVRAMVDCFLVLMIPGAGDDVQGIKKGVIELADLLIINKAEGPNRTKAMAAQAEARRVLRFLRPATEAWQTPALLASALQGEGIAEVWEAVDRYFGLIQQTGQQERRRRSQAVAWLRTLVQEGVWAQFMGQPGLLEEMAKVELAVAEGRLPVVQAAGHLLASRCRASVDT